MVGGERGRGGGGGAEREHHSIGTRTKKRDTFKNKEHNKIYENTNKCKQKESVHTQKKTTKKKSQISTRLA